MRHFTCVDQIISHVDQKIFNRFGNTPRQLSLRLMRVNHSGEVCAQALYHGQAFVARSKDLEKKLKEAAAEEQAHLEGCKRRLEELGGQPSVFAPVWGAGSFGIGILAGLAGDKISLGFIAETEHQVTHHLEKHLQLLPEEDIESRALLTKMRDDELRHATNAINEGGVPLPWLVRKLMKATAKIMTTTARYL